MCGIVGAVANDNIVPMLLEGLLRLEYRGMTLPDWLSRVMACKDCARRTA